MVWSEPSEYIRYIAIYILSCRAIAIYDLPINLRYIYKRVSPLIDTRLLPCACACLEGKDHRGRLDVDCNCSTNEYEPKQKLLHMAKELKLKYSKEKALAQLKRTQGPNATCVGDIDAGQITTKLRKVGLKQAWSKMCRKHCFSK